MTGILRLEDPVTSVRGIGEAKALQLERLGIRTVEDLISSVVFTRARR